MPELNVTSQIDQLNAILRDTALGFVSHRHQLIDGGVPKELANEMTRVLHERWAANLFPGAAGDLSRLFGK